VYLRETSRPSRHDPLVLAAQTSKRQVERLAKLEANWDGFGSEKPSRDAISLALRTLPEWIVSAERAGGWSLPHVAANEDGEVLFEWWRSDKKLTLFVRPDGIDYLRTWGPNVHSDMDDGVLSSDTFPSLWAWFSL
jgi:hypothetical protein